MNRPILTVLSLSTISLLLLITFLLNTPIPNPQNPQHPSQKKTLEHKASKPIHPRPITQHQTSQKADNNPVFCTGEATINGETFAFLTDPNLSESYMLAFTPNSQGNQLLTYENKTGEALINQKTRTIIPANESDKTLTAQTHDSYWEGYSKGYDLFERFGSMLPSEEITETGEISKIWEPVLQSDVQLRELPQNIQNALWQTPITQAETLQTFPAKEQPYWQGFLHGAYAGLAGNTDERKLSKWTPYDGEPNLTSPKRATAREGEIFQFQITSSTPATFRAENLPAGLHLNNKTGMIYGVPQPNQSNKKDLNVYETTISSSNLKGTTKTTMEISILPDK